MSSDRKIRKEMNREAVKFYRDLNRSVNRGRYGIYVLWDSGRSGYICNSEYDYSEDIDDAKVWPTYSSASKAAQYIRNYYAVRDVEVVSL